MLLRLTRRHEFFGFSVFHVDPLLYQQDLGAAALLKFPRSTAGDGPQFFKCLNIFSVIVREATEAAPPWLIYAET